MAVALLLLRVAAAALRAAAHPLPRQAVAGDAVRGVEAPALGGGHRVVDQGEDARAGLHLHRFVVGHTGDLWKNVHGG